VILNAVKLENHRPGGWHRRTQNGNWLGNTFRKKVVKPVSIN
jgi:hypothetical protein